MSFTNGPLMKITPICAREPKTGVDNGSIDIGYHDDSFAYSTLSVANGGQDWKTCLAEAHPT